MGLPGGAFPALLCLQLVLQGLCVLLQLVNLLLCLLPRSVGRGLLLGCCIQTRLHMQPSTRCVPDGSLAA